MLWLRSGAGGGVGGAGGGRHRGPPFLGGGPTPPPALTQLGVNRLRCPAAGHSPLADLRRTFRRGRSPFAGTAPGRRLALATPPSAGRAPYSSKPTRPGGCRLLTSPSKQPGDDQASGVWRLSFASGVWRPRPASGVRAHAWGPRPGLRPPVASVRRLACGLPECGVAAGRIELLRLPVALPMAIQAVTRSRLPGRPRSTTHPSPRVPAAPGGDRGNAPETQPQHQWAARPTRTPMVPRRDETGGGCIRRTRRVSPLPSGATASDASPTSAWRPRENSWPNCPSHGPAPAQIRGRTCSADLAAKRAVPGGSDGRAPGEPGTQIFRS